jgi:hypothetical protein
MVVTVYVPLAGSAPVTAIVATTTRGPGTSYAVAAQRQPMTTNAKSPVAPDTETEALVTHSGRLFAATGQWENPGPSAFGQILVKRSKTSPGGQIHHDGYDCNFHPADGTAWVASSTLSSLRLSTESKGRHS